MISAISNQNQRGEKSKRIKGKYFDWERKGFKGMRRVYLVLAFNGGFQLTYRLKLLAKTLSMKFAYLIKTGRKIEINPIESCQTLFK